MKYLLLITLVLLAIFGVASAELPVINHQTVIENPVANYGVPSNDTRYAEKIAVDGEWMVISSYEELLQGGDYSGAVYIYNYDGSSWLLHTKLTNPTDSPRFGTSLAIDGSDLAIVASEGTYLYALTGDEWQQQVFFPVTFNSTSISLESGVLAVGNRQTTVWTFLKNGGIWEQIDTLTTPLIDIENYGHDLDLTGGGNTLFVGSPNSEKNGGSVYVYTRSLNAWSLDTTLTEIVQSGAYGESVDVLTAGDDFIVAVGTPSNIPDVGGSAFVYRQSSGVWTNILSVSDPITSYDVGYGQFGYEVKLIDSNTIIVGALIAGDSSLDLLPSRIYIYNLTTAQQLAEIVSPRALDANGDGRNDFDGFGKQVEFVGVNDTLQIIVSAPSTFEDFDGGKLYIFSHDPNAEELVRAGDFEALAPRALILDSWNTRPGARRVCKDIGADGSKCAVRFASGIKSMAFQRVPLAGLDIAAGDALLLQADIMATNKARVKLTLNVVYMDGFKRSVAVAAVKTGGVYKRLLSAPGLFIADRVIQKITVVANYNGGVGVARIDNVSLVKVDGNN